MNERQILIRQKFREQYTLLIEMDSMLVNSLLKSKTESRYDFSIINIDYNNDIECRLIQLDIFIQESNNPLIKEIAEVTAAFNRMFNELHLKINNKGEILEVLNLSLILSKWQQTKQLMQEATNKNEDLKKFILINDALMANTEKIKAAIQANEFLQIYFGDVYGIDLPNADKIIKRANYFNTAYLQWKVYMSSNATPNSLSNTLTVNTTANPLRVLDRQFYQDAYKQFQEQIDITKLNTKLSEESFHTIDLKTGKIKKVDLIKKEIADPQKLYIIMKYSMKNDTIEKEIQ